MATNKRGKSRKGRRPLFYVDNPRTSELQWLDEVKKKKPEIEQPDDQLLIHSAAAMVVEPDTEVGSEQEEEQQLQSELREKILREPWPG